MPARGASVQELRRESERSRAALTATVERLRDKVGDTTSEIKSRLSPGYIKQEIKDYVREERVSLTQTLQQKAKENPLQAVAVGAAVAYPALGLLRAIPLPLMLIGAGLFFTSQRGRQTASDAKVKLDDVVQQGSEKISDLATAAKSNLDARTAGLRSDIGDARDVASSTADRVVDKARTAMHDVRDAVKDAAANLTGTAEGGVAQASALKDSAVQSVAATQNATANFLKDNALLVAGVGAALGAFIAASLPSSEAEDKLFGAGSDRLKAKARQAAAQGMDKATDYAAQAAGAVATAAAREGLNSSGVQGALNTVTEGVRAVANRGLQTATGAKAPANETMSERNAI
jgi:ElaB/YqjD/DUF883 family membrane-anchored ribosome-binding protein